MEARRTNLTWAELVGKLREERQALTDDFLQRFIEADHYEPGLVDLEDVHDNALETMDMFMYHLAGEEPPANIAALPQQIGARRARQGVPVEQFLEAVRLDFRVLWKGLERVASPDHIDLLVGNVERILNVVDRYVSEVHQAFIDEEARLTRDSRIAQERALSRLFTGELTPGMVTEIASTLGLREGADFEVLVATGDDGTWLADEFRGDPRVGVHERGGGAIAFRERAGLSDWPEERGDLRGGYVGHAAGLARVPGAAATAKILAAQSVAGSLVTVEEGWMTVAAEQLERVMPEFGEVVAVELAQLSDHERARMIEAVHTFARTGSVKESADKLFCHRNTIVNRLRSFHEITGLDVTIPQQAAWALVALAGLPGHGSQRK